MMPNKSSDSYNESCVFIAKLFHFQYAITITSMVTVLLRSVHITCIIGTSQSLSRRNFDH